MDTGHKPTTTNTMVSHLYTNYFDHYFIQDDFTVNWHCEWQVGSQSSIHHIVFTNITFDNFKITFTKHEFKVCFICNANLKKAIMFCKQATFDKMCAICLLKSKHCMSSKILKLHNNFPKIH